MNQTAFSQLRMIERAAAPSVPSGFAAVYTKTDGFLYFRNDAGEEVQITNADGVVGGGGSSSAGLLEFQFSPWQFLRGEEPLIESGGELYLQWAQDSEAIYWTPWLRIPQAFVEAKTGNNQLILELGLGAPEQISADLLALAEYWISSRKVIPFGIPNAKWERNGYANWGTFTEYQDGATLYVANSSGLEGMGFFGSECYLEQGAELDAGSCIMSLSVHSGDNSTGREFTVAVFPADNAVEPTTEAHWTEVLASRESYVDAHFTPTTGNYNIDVTALVQSIINRPGWTAGNTIEFVVYTYEPAGQYIHFSASWTVSGLGSQPAEPFAGAQMLLWEGEEGLRGEDDGIGIGGMTPIETSITFAPTSANTKRVFRNVWYGWTPGVNEFEMAAYTWVRFRLERGPGGSAEPLKLHYARVAIEPAPTYGYGYGE